MTINPEIKEILGTFNIPVDDGVAYLLAVHYDSRPSYTPISLIEKVKRTGILGLDDSQTLSWNIPLFEEQIVGFEWVKDWLQMFARLDKAKAGNYKETVTRMKKFFTTHIDMFVTKEEVMEATEMYLKKVSNPTYLITAKYFISKGAGADRTSTLLEWVERLRSAKQEDEGRASLQNTMQ